MKNVGKIAAILLSLCLFNACTTIDEKAIEVAGFYDANIVNGYYNFDLQISLDGNDDVLIEALFDDYDFEVIRADLDRHANGVIDFDIRSQSVYGGAILRGDGEYIDGYLQLDYSIDWGWDRIHYRMVAEQF